MGNPYSDALIEETKTLDGNNPFNEISDEKEVQIKDKSTKRKFHYEDKKKPNNYFNLILDSDYKDMELDIKGLRYVTYQDKISGKKIIELERRENHYLSEEGAEDLLMELKGHLSSDIKLGVLKEEEFLMTMEIVRKTFIKYIRNNLERLGMDTESKQRKARPLIVMILNRIRAVYSRSISGIENKRSHGDINLSGALDMENDSKFILDDEKN